MAPFAIRPICLIACLPLLGSAVILHSKTVLAQTETATVDPVAEGLNDEGKALYKQKDFAGAEAKFKQATKRSPDPKYFFNLCATREKQGKLEAALEACDQVYLHNPEERLKAKTGQRAAAIRSKMRNRPQNQNPPPPDSGGGNQQQPPPPDNGQPPPNVGTGQGQGSSTGTPPPTNYPYSPAASYPSSPEGPTGVGDYRWSIGGEIGPAVNGNLGDSQDSVGGALKINLDWILNKPSAIGLRTYLDVFSLQGADLDTDLGIVSVGAGLFMHIPITAKLNFTPMVGVHLGSITTAEIAATDDSFFTAGFKADLGFQWLFGYKDRNVLTFVPMSVSYFLPAATSTGGDAASDYGLDQAGSIYAFSIGYQYRFSSFLGGIVTLE